MRASGSADGGDTRRPEEGLSSQEPPTQRHGTRLVRCMSKTGEKRVVVYESRHEQRWIDTAEGDILELSEMR